MADGSDRSEKTAPPLKGAAAVIGRPAPTRKQLLLGGGHLAALWALAFVQPLLDLLGKTPDFFIARNNTPADILIVAIGFTLVPPLVLLAVEWLISKLSTKAYNGVHFTFLTLIAAFLFARPIGDQLDTWTAVVFLLALILAGALAWAIFRFNFLRNLMDILILAPLVIVLLFVFASKSSEVIFPKDTGYTLAKDSGSNRPIVLIIFDELGTDDLMNRSGQIDGQRFPNFARMARTGTWYRNQATTAFLTPLAVPGILTGTERPADTLPTWRARPDSIFSQFARGRKVHVQEPVTAVCPPMVCGADQEDLGDKARLKALWSDLKYVEGRLVLPPRLADTLPDVSTNFQGFGAHGGGDGNGGQKVIRKKGKLFVKAWSNGSPQEYRQFISQFPTADRSLIVMHMSLPHTRWRFDTRGREYDETPISELSDGIKQWLVNENGIATAQARMLTQTAFADEILGEIRRKLERNGLWDKAMVVVAADHGISFEGGDVPQRQSTSSSMGEVANPPLFIKYPGQKHGGVSDEHTSTVDIVPTIARALGVKRLYPTDGVPLQDPVPNRDIKITRAAGDPLMATYAEMIAQRDQALARADQRLGAGPIYTLGPAPELIGRKVDPVPMQLDEARLDRPGLWGEVRPNTEPLPIFITGTVPGETSDDPESSPVIAVAVNGVIRGSSKLFPFKDASRFGVLIDPADLKPGRNGIGIYRVQGKQLIPLGGNRRARFPFIDAAAAAK